MPGLGEDRERVAESLREIFTLHNELVYLVALCGATFIFGIHRLTAARGERRRRAATTIFDMTFWVSTGAFALHNALITHSLHNRSQVGIDAVALFVVAMTMHFTINDYGMRRRFFDAYQEAGRWLLALVTGWLAGFIIDTGDAPFLLILAFISGGTVIHVLSEEIPEERSGHLMHPHPDSPSPPRQDPVHTMDCEDCFFGKVRKTRGRLRLLLTDGCKRMERK